MFPGVAHAFLHGRNQLAENVENSEGHRGAGWKGIPDGGCSVYPYLTIFTKIRGPSTSRRDSALRYSPTRSDVHVDP